MKNRFLIPVLAAAMMASVSCANLNTTTLLQGGMQAAQAMTISDSDVRAYVAQYVSQLDAQSAVLPESDAYTKRLRRITSGLTNVDGVPLNFKVYKTNDVNAFACADGSVRVYSGLMDLMSDDFAYSFLKAAGKNPKCLMQSFQKLQSLESKGGQTSDMVSTLFSSHPDIANRISRIQSKLKADGLL